MKLLFTAEAWDDYIYWQDIDSDVLRRIDALIRGRAPGSLQGHRQARAAEG